MSCVNLNRLKRFKTLCEDDILCGTEQDCMYGQGPSVSRLKLTPGKYLACLGEILSPSLFYCSLYDPKDQFDRHLNLFYSHHEEFYQLTSGLPPGSICVAKFSVDNVWYRGVILEVQMPTQSYSASNKIYKIYFIDFGNVDWVKQTEVRKMDPTFAARPVQSFLCGLVELFSNDGDDWSETDITKFIDYATNTSLFIYIDVVDMSLTSELLRENRYYQPILLPNPNNISQVEVSVDIQIADLYKWILENLSAFEMGLADSLDLLDNNLATKFADYIKQLELYGVLRKPSQDPIANQKDGEVNSVLWQVHPANVDFSVADPQCVKPAPSLSQIVAQSKHNLLQEQENLLPCATESDVKLENGSPLYTFGKKVVISTSLTHKMKVEQNGVSGHTIQQPSNPFSPVGGQPMSLCADSTNVTAECKSEPCIVADQMPPPQWFPQPKVRSKKCKSGRSKDANNEDKGDKLSGESGSVSSKSSHNRKKNKRDLDSPHFPPDIGREDGAHQISEPFPITPSISSSTPKEASEVPGASQLPVSSVPISLCSSRCTTPLSTKITDESAEELMANLDDPDSADSNDEDRCGSPVYLSCSAPAVKFSYSNPVCIPSYIRGIPDTILPTLEFDALIMSAVNSPGSFFITPIDSEYRSIVKWIEEALSQHHPIMTASTFDKFLCDMKLSAGSVCCVDSLDSLFRCCVIRETGSNEASEHKHRPRMAASSRVMEIKKELEASKAEAAAKSNLKHFECLSIDYGDRFVTSSENIYPLSPHFEDIPCLSVKCKLKDLKPMSEGKVVDKWPAQSMQLFEKALSASDYRVRVFLGEKASFDNDQSDGSTGPALEVYLFLRNPIESDPEVKSVPGRIHDISVNEQFAESRLASASGLIADIMENNKLTGSRDPSSDSSDDDVDCNPMRDIYIRNKIKDYFEEEAKSWRKPDNGAKRPICGHFQNFDHCKYGRHCKFRHVKNSDDDEEDDASSAALDQFYKELVVMQDYEIPVRDLPEAGSWISIIPTCLYKTMNFYALLEHGSSRLDTLDFKGSDDADCLSRLNELNFEINTVYEDKLQSPFSYKFYYPLGSRIAALYQKDEKFYRAKVIDHDPKTNDIEIVYEDYGEFDKIKSNSVFPLKRQFLDAMPPQAVSCFFSGISMPESISEWPQSTLDYVNQKIAFKSLHARVKEVTSTGILYLEVYNFSEKRSSHHTDIFSRSLNHHLINVGHAAKAQPPKPVEPGLRVGKYFPG